MDDMKRKLNLHHTPLHHLDRPKHGHSGTQAEGRTFAAETIHFRVVLQYLWVSPDAVGTNGVWHEKRTPSWTAWGTAIS
eukprot:CAMPEP_0170176798 /NCGR_PEP_ID=MMETSP0040_2-20121228/9594_1 /TAXON_ID=641309 /ORGANISM="Lotharella oceanica, Strain CCMP622" /LENGTH=78 /DNA_ID=CAMNT_0010419235 /DNA_START=253 /DNA_END=489 /DNA_ORIENTATION=+